MRLRLGNLSLSVFLSVLIHFFVRLSLHPLLFSTDVLDLLHMGKNSQTNNQSRGGPGLHETEQYPHLVSNGSPRGIILYSILFLLLFLSRNLYENNPLGNSFFSSHFMFQVPLSNIFVFPVSVFPWFVSSTNCKVESGIFWTREKDIGQFRQGQGKGGEDGNQEGE